LFRRIFNYYVEDGKYDTSILESALQEALGSDPLFGPTISRVSGMKFAVTTTTISDATLCLISNYNGEGQNSTDSSRSGFEVVDQAKEILGYKHLREKKATDSILLWEA
jgi:hypothetical protein